MAGSFQNSAQQPQEADVFFTIGLLLLLPRSKYLARVSFGKEDVIQFQFERLHPIMTGRAWQQVHQEADSRQEGYEISSLS